MRALSEMSYLLLRLPSRRVIEAGKGLETGLAHSDRYHSTIETEPPRRESPAAAS